MRLLSVLNPSKIFFRRLFRSLRMDSDSEDDMLYYSHQKLSSLIRQKGNKSDAIKEYLQNLNYQPIKDFEPGLEWFNVSEPLSFSKYLKGKIVVLDFFTYCCINCMHIIPDLRAVEKEFSIEDGLVVIGVHSAKFENEKISSNILAAVQRYNITHAVVNDHHSQMWKNCSVNCWPTLLILGPNANPIVMLMGEGHKENLRSYIQASLEYYKSKKEISDHSIPFKSAYHLLPDLKGPLLFPGKIVNFIQENQEILAISDTGNNRILIVKADGTILNQVGSGKAGLRDGTLSNSEFNAPQGLVFQNENILFVADTENHAIRKIDLKNNKVETVTGTGDQGHDMVGGKLWTQQIISSPWDVCIYQTADMDMTFYPDGNPPLRNVLIIAMAGTHQIWALFLEDTVWWKCKKYSAGSCLAIAGSGREENRNNAYPHAAGFAQPSGLALCKKNKEVYIADSESSSIRRLSLVDGKVTPVVGGDRNPNNLFAFGDKDGSFCEAKLQHVLGLTMSKDEDTLLVADTYNHKLKKVDITQNSVTTIPTSNVDTTDGKASLNEPAGLCVSTDGKKIYLADTNNHSIKILKLNPDYSVKRVTNLDLNLPANTQIDEQLKHQVFECKGITVNSKGGKIILNVKILFSGDLKLTHEAPQKWIVKLPDSTWSCVPSSGDSVKDIDVVVSVPSGQDNKIDFVFDLVTCTTETCLPKNFLIRVPVSFTSNCATNLQQTILVNLDPNNIQVV